MSEGIQLDEKLKADAKILAEGVETDFWILIKEMIVKLRDEAKDALVLVEPTDVSGISQLQSTAKVVDQLISVVEDTAKLNVQAE